MSMNVPGPAGGERVSAKDQALTKGPWAAGPPIEAPKDLGGTTRRLLRRMRVERTGGITVLVLTIFSVTMTSLGPKILGHGTDIIVRGVLSRKGVDFHALRNVLLGALALFLASSFLSWVQGYILAGVVQRSMYRLRSEV